MERKRKGVTFYEEERVGDLGVAGQRASASESMRREGENSL